MALELFLWFMAEVYCLCLLHNKVMYHFCSQQQQLAWQLLQCLAAHRLAFYNPSLCSSTSPVPGTLQNSTTNFKSSVNPFV